MSKSRGAVKIPSHQTLHLAFGHLKRLLQEPQWFGSSQGLLILVGARAPDLEDDDHGDDDG